MTSKPSCPGSPSPSRPILNLVARSAIVLGCVGSNDAAGLRAAEAPANAAAKAPRDVAADEVAGVVVDREGRPVEGATVDAWTWYPGNETQTDADGVFRLKGLDSRERAEILISKAGYSPQHFAQWPTGAKGRVVTLGQKTFFEGIVRDQDGKPVPKAAIRASFGPVEGDGVSIGEVTLSGESDEAGRYRLYVKPDKYDIQVAAAGKGVARLGDVVIQEDEAKQLPIDLRPGVRFEARVVDSESGAPVEGFVLFQWRPPFHMARSNAEGKIVLTDLMPGAIELNCGGGENISDHPGLQHFGNGSFGRWWSENCIKEWNRKKIDDTKSGWQRNFDDLDFKLEVGMSPVTIVVERGVTISGRVTDPKGQPVEGATVAPARTGSGNSLTGDTRYSVTSKADGSYEVVLPASNRTQYNLIVHDGKYGEWRKWANGVSAPMQTRPGQVVEGLNLQLTDPVTVRGRVLSGGKPAANREVRAHSALRDENRYYDPTTKTDSDGKFELRFVRPGKHYIQAEPFWLDATQAKNGSALVDLKPGEVLENLELRAAPLSRARSGPEAAIGNRKFRARVVDAEKKPVADVSVGIGLLGVLPYAGGFADNAAKVLGASKTDAEGLLALNTEFLAQMRLSSFHLFAVDIAGKRAGLAMVTVDDESTTDSETGVTTVEIRLEPARLLRLHLDAQKFDSLSVRPGQLALVVSRDGSPVQRTLLEKPGDFEMLLPAGNYDIEISGEHCDFAPESLSIEPGMGSHDARLELIPTRLAKLLGHPAPEFVSLKAGDRPLPTLEKLRGKVVILDFWGHWCGPCVQAMPSLMKLYDEFHERGVEVVAIHDDSVESVEALKPILEKLQSEHWKGRVLPFEVVLDGGGETSIPDSEASTRGGTTAQYGIRSFPTTILIDRKGNVVRQIEVRDEASARRAIEEVLGDSKK